MPTDPRTCWGECEFALVESRGIQFEDDGTTPFKRCHDEFRHWRVYLGGERSLRGQTEVIRKRPPAEWQLPPGYSGSGQVVVVLYPGFRYWRTYPAAGEIEFQGRVSCHPDEAFQLIAVGAGTYA